MDAAEFEALFHARADSARMRFTEADVRFVQMMILHHAQALEMSALSGDRTTNPGILTLSARIIGGQREEIARMREWLESRGLSEAEVAPASGVPNGVPDAAPVAPPGHDQTMHDGPVHDMPGMRSAGHLMAGLLTLAEMEELAGATGSDFDRLYLSYMIYHHRGAVQMVEELFSTDGAGREDEVFRLAAETRVDQSAEVARMERMLSVLSARFESP
jgi:uncharacterized protein (DUF305 family)